MKKCAYCGRENHDDGVTCTECGTSFHPTPDVPRPFNLRRRLLAFCGIYPDGFVCRPPVFGALAITAPITGFAIAWVIAALAFPHEDADLTPFLTILLLGIVSALAGLFRGEKYRALSYIGLGVDIFLFFVTYVCASLSFRC